MTYRNYLKMLLLAGLMQGSTGLLAHTKLESATPADGASLGEVPKALELGFSEDVQLLKLEVATEAGVAQEIDFKPNATATKTFSIPLPALAADAYVVRWTVLGADGHRVEGSLGFLVDPVAHEPAGAGTEPDSD